MSGPVPKNRRQRRAEARHHTPPDIQRRVPTYIGRNRRLLGITHRHPWASWPLRRIARLRPDDIALGPAPARPGERHRRDAQDEHARDREALVLEARLRRELRQIHDLMRRWGLFSDLLGAR